MKTRIHILIALSGLDPENPVRKRPENLRKILTAALATNDLKQICQAIDSGISSNSSVTRLAVAAGIHRTTLFRAFRVQKGPSLDTMMRVIRVLGFQLIVKEKSKNNSFTAKRSRAFAQALESQNMELLGELFAAAYREQDTHAVFAEKAGISREQLYRLFKGPKTPRLGTVVAYLNALNLRFSVQRI